MKVKELIKRLQKYDPNAEVAVTYPLGTYAARDGARDVERVKKGRVEWQGCDFSELIEKDSDISDEDEVVERVLLVS